ncbi:hypothetical protein [Epilithonimonas sp.]|nr:hypothetical protein [Epilithonimonas sp.]
MNYTIPKGVKLIQVGLYEDYIVNPFIEHPTKVFEKTINFTETD